MKKGTHLVDNDLDKVGEVGVNVINNHAHTLGLAGIQGAGDVTRHVLLEHGLDVTVVLLVRREDGLAT